MIPGDYILLLQWGDDEPEVYWMRSYEQAQSRGNTLIENRGRAPDVALIYERQECPTRDKMQVVGRRMEKLGTWV